MAPDDSSAPMAATVMDKEGAGASATSPKKASPSKRSTKPRPEACEKRRARSDLPRKKIVPNRRIKSITLSHLSDRRLRKGESGGHLWWSIFDGHL